MDKSLREQLEEALKESKKLQRRLQESKKQIFELGAEIQRLRGALEGKARDKVVIRPARPPREVKVVEAGTREE